jgi:hypothetical protein
MTDKSKHAKTDLTGELAELDQALAEGTPSGGLVGALRELLQRSGVVLPPPKATAPEESEKPTELDE